MIILRESNLLKRDIVRDGERERRRGREEEKDRTKDRLIVHYS